jgi:hypothetical protein
MHSGLLEISNLDQLKENLVKVLAVALIVADRGHHPPG